MPINKNISPYYEDFDKTKNFLQILFKGGKAVQTRELSQISSILQNQVSSLSNHLFKDGTSIYEAEIKTNFNRTVLEFDGVETFSAGDFLNKTIAVGTIGSEEVKAVVKSEDVTNQKLLVNITGGAFSDSDLIHIIDEDGFGYDVDPRTDPYGELTTNPNQGTLKSSNAVVSDALSASLTAGIVYVDGYFIDVSSEEILADDSGSSDSYKIGFLLTEEFITSDDDPSLLDNAAGTPNFNAPGADRYKASVSLVSYSSAEYGSIPSNFILVVEVINGEIVLDQNKTQYGDILKMLAERTHDQSGHYSIDDFGLDIITNGSDSSKLDYRLEAGKAVVNGFSVETLGTIVKTADKARTFDSLSASVYAEYGHYFCVGLKDTATDNSEFDIVGLPDVETKEKIYFWGTLNGGQNDSELLGQGRIISLRRESKKLLVFFSDGDDAGNNKISSYFSAVKSVSTSNTAGGATYMNVLSDAGSLDLRGHENPNLLFELPSTATKSIGTNTVSYEVNSKFNNLPVVVDATEWKISITAPDNYTDFETTNPYGIISIINNSTGAVLTPSLDGTRTPVVTNSDGVASTIDIFLGSDPGGNVDVAIRMERHANDGESKTKSVSTVTETSAFTYSNALGNVINLANHDIIDIVSVKTNPGGVAIDFEASTGVLDNGQRDYMYLPGTVTFSAGDAELTDGIIYDIEYRHYTHSGSGDYFNVNSYPDYDIIPSYTTFDGNDTFELRDSFDFRRTLADINSGVLTIHPGTNITVSNYDKYLPRYDLITVDENGVFTVNQGNPEESPKSPNVSDKVMVLYEVYVPPYVFDPKDTDFKKRDNRNYTMEEIGNLDKRISSLEYYNSINLLEKKALELEIVDSNGLNKFKNGVFVDNFKGHGQGDIQHLDYDIAIDTDLQLARTPVVLDHKDLTEGGASSNVTIHPNITTLSYTTTPAIEQDRASETINVNPYSVFSWNGSMEIQPPSDNWVSTTRLPDRVTNFRGQTAAWTGLLAQANRQAGFGLEWGSWSRNWIGSTVESSFETRNRQFTVNNSLQEVVNETIRSFDVRRNDFLNTRFGVRTSLGPQLQRRNIGNRVTSSSIVPWIRSRTVTFEASGLRPFTIMIPTFDDVDVSANITWDVANPGGKTDASGRIKGTFNIPGDTFRTGSRILRLADDLINPTASAETTYLAQGLMNNVQGNIIGVEVPTIRRTQVRQNFITSSRETVETSNRVQTTLTGWFDPVAQSFLVTSEGGMFVSDIDVYFKYKDSNLPVTISIVTTENGYPSQRELPLAKKTLYPNGTSDVKAIVKGSGGELPAHASSVDNTNADQATKFTFDNPIKLEQGVEYAFILTTNSDNYEVFLGEIGAKDLAGNLITKQPYAGVLFKSQNSSTWNADQTKDIKFTISRCVFNSSGVYDLEASGTDQDVTAMNLNIETSLPSKTNISWTYQFVEDGAPVSTITKSDVEFKTLKTIPVSTPLSVVGNLSTNVDNLSPVINNKRMSSLILENDVDIASGADSNGRYSAGTYLTKTIKLATVSDDIKVIFNGIKPGNSEIDVYYRLGTTIPRFVRVEDLAIDSDFYEEFATDVEKVLRDQDKGNVSYVYHYEDTGTGTVNKQTGSAIISDLTSTSTPGERKLYLKEISDVTKYLDAGDASVTFEKVIISTDINIAAPSSNDFEYNAIQSYNIDEYVIYNNKIYKSTTGSNSGNTPSQFSTEWDEVAAYFVQTGFQPGVDGDHIVEEDSSVEWSQMVEESGALSTEDPEKVFVEYTYIPEKSIDEEFTSFAIKVELKAKNKIDIPIFADFRTIATY